MQKPKADIFNFDPGDHDTQLLGIIFKHPRHMERAAKVVEPHMFKKEGSKIIWAFFKDALMSGTPMADASIEARLIELAVDHADGCRQVAVQVGDILTMPGSTNPDFFIDRFKDDYFERENKRINNMISVAVKSGKPIESLLVARDNITAEKTGKEVMDKAWLSDAFDYYDKSKDKLRAVESVDTGFPTLDTLTGGWRKKNMIIIAAKPGTGKTAFAMNTILTAMATSNVVFFSTEMGSHEITNRFLSMLSGIDCRKLDTHPELLTDDEFDKIIVAKKKLRAAGGNLSLVCKSLTMDEIDQHCKRVRFINKSVDMIVIDYIQRIRTPAGTSREREVAEISSRVKDLAMEYDCPVLAIAQPSRALDKRGDDKPRNSDLRDSGQLEQDADFIAWLHTANKPTVDVERYPVEFIVTKNRHGPVSEIQLQFKTRILTFAEK